MDATWLNHNPALAQQAFPFAGAWVEGVADGHPSGGGAAFPLRLAIDPAGIAAVAAAYFAVDRQAVFLFCRIREEIWVGLALAVECGALLRGKK